MKVEKPRYLTVEAGLFLFLAGIEVLSWAWFLRPLGFANRWFVRDLIQTIVTGLAGWWLWKGKVWGYVLGVAVGGFWLWAAARIFPISAPAASFYLVLGFVILVGLFLPGSRRWVASAWHDRSALASVGHD